MKKVNLLSRAEMKAVMGGVPIASYCGEGMVLAECTFQYPVVVHHEGHWEGNIWIAGYSSSEMHNISTGGCMTEGEYYNNQANCRLLGEGGPYAV